MSDDTGFLAKMVMTGIIIVFAIPGLVIEPGPLSEIVAVGGLAAVWGFGDIFDGGN